jgi:hypothetical protein
MAWHSGQQPTRNPYHSRALPMIVAKAKEGAFGDRIESRSIAHIQPDSTPAKEFRRRMLPTCYHCSREFLIFLERGVWLCMVLAYRRQRLEFVAALHSGEAKEIGRHRARHRAC